MILGIESSCDESALAVFDPKKGLEGEWVSSQVSLHAEYGGVVPDLASREHLNNFGPLLADVSRSRDLREIEEIAVTTGPGLAGCLAMGLSVANALSLALNVPVYPANHLRAHAQSVFIPLHEEDPAEFEKRLDTLFPHLSLVVSGGNTLLARMDRDRSIRILGQTIDDAAGEALDKGAKLMGLGYPGGPKLESIGLEGDSKRFAFPRALLDKPTDDFSFSGLKTSLRYLLEKLSEEDLKRCLADLCASYQEAVVDVLIRKTQKVLGKEEFRSIGLSGGVSNNAELRKRFADLGNRYQCRSLIANRAHTGDNAAMIAFSRYFEMSARISRPLDIKPSATIEGNS